MALRTRRSHRFGGLTGGITFVALARAPQRAGEHGSAIARQAANAASASGGDFDAETASPLQSQGGGQIADRSLVVGIAAEVRGFSPVNSMQSKYVEDPVQGSLFLQDEQGRWSPAVAAERLTMSAHLWTIQ